MTSTPNEVPVATQNDEIITYLRETRTKIKTIEKELGELDGIRNIRIKILENTDLTSKETIQKEDYDNLNTNLAELKENEKSYIDLLKKSSEVYLLLLFNAFRGHLSERVPSFFCIGH